MSNRDYWLLALEQWLVANRPSSSSSASACRKAAAGALAITGPVVGICSGTRENFRRLQRIFFLDSSHDLMRFLIADLGESHSCCCLRCGL